MKVGKSNPKKLTYEDSKALLEVLKARFEKNPKRHKGLAWEKVRTRLEANPEKLRALHEMERSGGEPDVVGCDKKTGECVFVDCSAETPKGRVSVCYDRAGLESRKEHKPKISAMDMAAAMGIELMSEEGYFDCKRWESLTPRHQVGSPLRRPSANAAARCMASVATAVCSSGTTARNPITPCAVSAAC